MVTMGELALMRSPGLGLGLQHGAAEGRDQRRTGQVSLSLGHGQPLLVHIGLGRSQLDGIGPGVQIGARFLRGLQAHPRRLHADLGLSQIQRAGAGLRLGQRLPRAGQLGLGGGDLGRSRLRAQPRAAPACWPGRPGLRPTLPAGRRSRRSVPDWPYPGPATPAVRRLRRWRHWMLYTRLRSLLARLSCSASVCCSSARARLS